LETATGLKLLDETRVIVIVRNVEPKVLPAVAEALYEGGIRVMEVTLNSKGALESIKELSALMQDKMWIGAGTVLDTADAKQAIQAGAGFLVTPNIDEDVIALSIEKGIPIYPGALTPTEIVKAWKAGAPAIKIFPSSSIGMAYIKELQGPLSHIPMVAVGGVNADNVQRFLEIGCYAVGVGGSLVDQSAIRQERFDRITASARALISGVNDYFNDKQQG
jgi:2-dehydro-3-deoxyphosphogluconate aldolase/(4S)-4-hydroxy-2-oxoglutarate aldolase